MTKSPALPSFILTCIQLPVQNVHAWVEILWFCESVDLDDSKLLSINITKEFELLALQEV